MECEPFHVVLFSTCNTTNILLFLFFSPRKLLNQNLTFVCSTVFSVARISPFERERKKWFYCHKMIIMQTKFKNTNIYKHFNKKKIFFSCFTFQIVLTYFVCKKKSSTNFIAVVACNQEYMKKQPLFDRWWKEKRNEGCYLYMFFSFS